MLDICVGRTVRPEAPVTCCADLEQPTGGHAGAFDLPPKRSTVTPRRLLIALPASAAILFAGTTQASGTSGPIYPIPTPQAAVTAAAAKSDAHAALSGKEAAKRL